MSGVERNGPAQGPRQHAAREAIAVELHARPSAAVRAPAKVSHLAFLTGEHAAEADRAHLARLCERLGAPAPPAGASHYFADLGPFRLKWERHTEFSTYTVFRPGGAGDPFAEPAVQAVPAAWLAETPGELLVAAHLAVEERSAPERDARSLAALFGSDAFVGARMTGGAAVAWTDFRIQGDGFSRILVRDLALTERQAGRLVQRLLEIETYRMVALLALPMARAATPELGAQERHLAEAIAEIAALGDAEDERRLLQRLTGVAAEVERIAAGSSYRFSAAEAYYALVRRRIEELREERIEGLPTIAEFLDRRLAPAMRTCEAVARRQEALARRVARAANLLRTRVDVTLEAQNRDLLASMDQRARLQLRLQQTVEGLSVAAISYYVLGILYFGFTALAEAGLRVDPTLARGIAIPLVVAGVWLGLRYLRRHLAADGG